MHEAASKPASEIPPPKNNGKKTKRFFAYSLGRSSRTYEFLKTIKPQFSAFQRVPTPVLDHSTSIACAYARKYNAMKKKPRAFKGGYRMADKGYRRGLLDFRPPSV